MSTLSASPSSSPCAVMDLLHSLPSPDRGEVRGAERWRRFQVVEWSAGWKSAALALALYETNDFKSLANHWHDQAVAQGKASGPYQGNSRFRRWWSSPGPSVPDEHERDTNEPRHEVYDVWLITDRSDREVRGLAIVDRWEPLVRDVPEIPMDARCRPRVAVPTRVFGQACFWVANAHRGHGLGTRMAQAVVDAYRPVIEAACIEQPCMPFMAARDRAFALMRRIAPWPMVTQNDYNLGQRRDMLHEALQRAEDWPNWPVPTITLDAPVRTSRRRPKP